MHADSLGIQPVTGSQGPAGQVVIECVRPGQRKIGDVFIAGHHQVGEIHRAAPQRLQKHGCVELRGPVRPFHRRAVDGHQLQRVPFDFQLLGRQPAAVFETDETSQPAMAGPDEQRRIERQAGDLGQFDFRRTNRRLEFERMFVESLHAAGNFVAVVENRAVAVDRAAFGLRGEQPRGQSIALCVS